MCFDDPIYLDRGSFEDLMVDTDQHRICWMYHDILSHPRIAWLFDKYAGKGTPIREAWTTMAWVAAGYQEDSFYLLFKWYEDFYDPPQRSDLYFVEREGPDGEIRVRFLNRDFQNKLERRELAIHAMTLSQMKAVWGDDEYLYYEKLYAAVIETAGQCLYYGDGLAAPLFHKISAGMTRYDQTGDCPYLVGVDCVYDAESPGYQTVKQFTKEEFAGKLNQIDDTRQLSAPVNAADVALTLDAQGYVMNLQVSEISFSAEEAALALGIPSLWFRLEDYADTIRVIAKGIGHGYGMSQYGADRYAGEGRDYKWILQHYFQGCEVKDSSSR